jgi:hypothetical protein
MAVSRHREHHLPRAVRREQDDQDAAEADDLLRDVRGLRGKAVQLLLAAERSGDLKTALQGVRESLRCLELLGKLEGRIDTRPRVDVWISPEWAEIRAALMLALQPYVEAREAAARALLALDEGPRDERSN